MIRYESRKTSCDTTGGRMGGRGRRRREESNVSGRREEKGHVEETWERGQRGWRSEKREGLNRSCPQGPHRIRLMKRRLFFHAASSELSSAPSKTQGAGKSTEVLYLKGIIWCIGRLFTSLQKIDTNLIALERIWSDGQQPVSLT